MADEERPAEHAGEHEHQGEHGEHGKHGAKGAQPPKNEKRKTALLVILTAVGVLIAWMTLRKNPGSQATSNAPVGSSANNPLNYPTSNGDVAGFGLGNTAGFDPNAYMALQSQLDQMNAQISKLAGTVGAGTHGGETINIYNNPPQVPRSPHSGTNSKPHPLAHPPHIPHSKPKPGGRVGSVFYDVRRGQSLSQIASLNHESLAQLERLNPASSLPSHNYNVIYPGERIRVK